MLPFCVHINSKSVSFLGLQYAQAFCMLNLQTLTNIHEGCTINNKLKVCICNLKCYIPCMLLKSEVLLFYDNNMSAINNLLSSITKTIQVTYVPSVDVFPPKFIPVPPNPPKPTSKNNSVILHVQLHFSCTIP